MMLMSHKDLLSRHFAVDMPPTDQTWGNREMYVRGDDRNKIAFVRQLAEAEVTADVVGPAGSAAAQSAAAESESLGD